MKDHNVNSYNLLYAQQILATLVPKKQSGPAHRPQSEPQNFVRLTQQKRALPAELPAAAPNPTGSEDCQEMVVTPPQQNFTDWESCIAWCIGITRAEAAFVVDSQGFIIATRGRIPGHGFECTGAEMIYAMDQLERIDPEAGNLLWIDLDFNKRRLVGFVTPMEDAAYFIVGLVSPESSYNASKHVMSKHIIESLPSMN
jgi:hypothetical protein